MLVVDRLAQLCGLVSRAHFRLRNPMQLVDELKNGALPVVARGLECLVKVVDEDDLRARVQPVSPSAGVIGLCTFALRTHNLVFALDFKEKPVFLNSVLVLSHGVAQRVFFPVEIFGLIGLENEDLATTGRHQVG